MHLSRPLPFRIGPARISNPIPSSAPNVDRHNWTKKYEETGHGFSREIEVTVSHIYIYAHIRTQNCDRFSHPNHSLKMIHCQRSLPLAIFSIFQIYSLPISFSFSLAFPFLIYRVLSSGASSVIGGTPSSDQLKALPLSLSFSFFR